MIMAQNEETMYIASTSDVETDKLTNNSKTDSKGSWKKVVVGGVAGILLGAGAMYANDAIAATQEAENPDAKPEDENIDAKPEGGEKPSQDAAVVNENESFKVADSVMDSQSFKAAFKAARAEVGPGGAFHWHGNIYSTYTEDEWNNMTDAEKNDYAEAVRPEVRPEEMNSSSHHTEDVAVASQHSRAEAVQENTNLHQTSDVSVADDQSADVHLVNAGEVQLADGSTATVGVYDVNGQQVNVVDFDQDGTPDVAIYDANGNGRIDVGEAVDLHTGQVISVDANNETDDITSDSNLQTASLENPDVAPDMPDYMSDADIQMT